MEHLEHSKYLKHLFIINPNAGLGKGKKLIPIIHQIAKKMGIEYSIEITTGPMDATKFAFKHLQTSKSLEEQIRIYAVGGDGTANEVLNGIVGEDLDGVGGNLHGVKNTDVEFAIIPAGTGNDFVRSITGNHKFRNNTIEQLIEDIINGIPCSVNSATINGLHFLNISSIGIDAITNFNMTNTTKKLPWLPAKAAYVVSALGTLIKDRNMDVEITLDDVTTKHRIILAAISNGRFYGGGIIPSPNAHPSDNLLDLCLVKAISRFRVLSLLPKYITGKHVNEKEVSFHKIKKVKITSANQMIINIDGESQLSTKLDIEIDKKMVKLIVPKWSPLMLYENNN